MLTATGTVLFVDVPLPKVLSRLEPQQYAVPVVVNAQADSPPWAIALNETPAGMLTATGALLWVVVPLPSWP
jgi:hypothetical protein